MDTTKKNRLLFWLMIFLVAVNLAALATYFFFPSADKVSSCGDASIHPGCLYRNQLGLSDEQASAVEVISEKYMEESTTLAVKIKSLRGEILDELSYPDPDTLQLYELTAKLVSLQAQLQKENIKHYLALKEVCTPEQAMRLSNLYRELYDCPMQQGNRMQQRHRPDHKPGR